MKVFGLSRFVPIALASAGVLCMLALTPAAAEMTAEQACTNDAFRLCNDLIPDRAKVGACLRRNARSISRDCRTVVMGGGTRKGTTKKHYRHHG